MNYLSLILCFLIYPVLGHGQVLVTSQVDNSTNDAIISNKAHWDIPYTKKTIRDAANPSYGVFNDQKFQEIITQKKLGNANAEYAYAFLYFAYQLYRFPSTNVAGAKEESEEIMWRLGNQDHALACEFLAKGGGRVLVEKNIKNPEEVKAKILHCFEVADRNGIDVSFAYGTELLFGNVSGVGDMFISNTEAVSQPDRLKKAAIQFEKCALHRRYPSCSARVEEMYYHGYGVKRDLMKAYAWARVVFEEGKKIKLDTEPLKSSYEHYFLLQETLTALEKERGDAYYLHLKNEWDL